MKALMRLTGAAFIAAVVMAGSAFGQATAEMWLPVSCNNEAAVKAYHDAMIRNSHNDQAAYMAKLEEALKISPDAFMPGSVKAFWNPKEIDAVLALPVGKLTKAEMLMRDALLKVKGDPASDLTEIAEAFTVEYPKTIEAYILADFMMFHMSDWKGVYKYSKKMTELDPNFGPGYHWLGYAYLRNGLPEKAVEAFTQYASLSPTESKPYGALGETYLELHNFPKAAECYEKSAALGSENSKYMASEVRKVLKDLEFTSEQKEVWNLVEQIWAMGSTGKTDALEPLLHENYNGWNNFSILTWTKKYLIEMAKGSDYTYKLQPVSVRITGDHAVASYFLEVKYPNQKIEGRSADFYIKEDGKWKLLGDNTYLNVVKEKAELSL